MSRWQYWSRGTSPQLGFSSFTMLAEAGRVMPGDPEQIAAQQGWTSKGYGWYQDQNGQTVARNVNGQMVVYDEPPTDAQTQPDMGNPTGAPTGQKPADRARSMGLRSNGRGGYVDPESGQVVARTVNNELVFYDRGPGGGVVSDGAGGQNAAIEQPSWQDPVTGLVVVPPAKPETPAETAAIPDPIPAQPPQGFADFIQRSKMDAYAKNNQQTQINQEVEQQQAELDQIFQSNEGMQLFKIGIDSTIKKGLSGSENAQDLAQRAQRVLEDEDTLKEFEYVSSQIEDPMQAGELLKKRTVQLAKLEKYNDLMNQYTEEAGGNFVEALKRVEEEHPNLGAGATSSYYDDTLQELGIQTPKQQEVQMNKQYDDEMGVNDVREAKPEQQIAGERVTYTLVYPGSAPAPSHFDDKDRQKMEKDIFRRASKIGEDYDQRPGEIVSVSWANNEDETNDKTENNKIALDALKTWRNEVLPTLEPGTIVHNDPAGGGRGGDQRERIYKLAGFGDLNDEYEGQYGFVVNDGEQNKVIPIDFDGRQQNSRARKIKEGLIRNIDYIITDSQVNRLCEALFA